MKSHVWRPLFVVIAIVAAIFLFRAFYVPDNFGSGEYLVAWTENRSNPAEIRGRRVSAAGILQGIVIVLDSNPDAPMDLFDGRPSNAPAVAASETAAEYLVTYHEHQENRKSSTSHRGCLLAKDG